MLLIILKMEHKEDKRITCLLRRVHFLEQSVKELKRLVSSFQVNQQVTAEQEPPGELLVEEQEEEINNQYDLTDPFIAPEGSVLSVSEQEQEDNTVLQARKRPRVGTYTENVVYHLEDEDSDYKVSRTQSTTTEPTTPRMVEQEHTTKDEQKEVKQSSIRVLINDADDDCSICLKQPKKGSTAFVCPVCKKVSHVKCFAGWVKMKDDINVSDNDVVVPIKCQNCNKPVAEINNNFSHPIYEYLGDEKSSSEKTNSICDVCGMYMSEIDHSYCSI